MKVPSPEDLDAMKRDSDRELKEALLDAASVIDRIANKEGNAEYSEVANDMLKIAEKL